MSRKFSQLSVGKKIATITGGLALVFVLGVVFVFSYQGSTKDIEAVADGFVVPNGWSKTQDRIVPPKIICLEGSCPQMQRSWWVGKIEQPQFDQFLKSNQNITMSASRCLDDNGSTGQITKCSSTANTEKYHIRAVVATDTSIQNGDSISISIEKR